MALDSGRNFLTTPQGDNGAIALIEAADNRSPQAVEYARDMGRRTALYYLAGGDRRAWTQRILGRTYDRVTPTGGIARLVPGTHPEDPSLFAEKVTFSDFEASREDGPGAYVVPAANPAASARPDPLDPDAFADGPSAPTAVIDSYVQYPGYEVRVDFTLRPYAVLTDAQIGVLLETYWDEAGNLGQVAYCNEYDRFVEIDEKFDPRLVTATQGQLVFRTQGGLDPPDGAAFAGQPRIPYPETTLTMRWYGVPYRYISSPRSFLRRWAMRVNQSAWRIQDYFFEPGELLYLGYDYRRYTQPWPENTLWPDDGGLTPLAQDLEKLADITLTFQYVRRTPLKPPPVPQRQCWIAAGHNLLPWFGPGNADTSHRGYYYVTSFDHERPDDEDAWAPVYESAPLQTLFTDPDALLPNPLVF